MFQARQSFLELGSAITLYAALLIGVAALEHTLHPQGAVRLLITLLPILGAIVVAWVILRGLWRMDEMQRRIQFDAIALSFLGTALITFSWGFAEMAGFPHLRAFQVWPIMGTLWAVGVAIARQRY